MWMFKDFVFTIFPHSPFPTMAVVEEREGSDVVALLQKRGINSDAKWIYFELHQFMYFCSVLLMHNSAYIHTLFKDEPQQNIKLSYSIT